VSSSRAAARIARTTRPGSSRRTAPWSGASQRLSRLQGLNAAAALARLYATVRLFVNFFQPSFKLARKERDGARVRKYYHAPATPYQRPLAEVQIPEAVQGRMQALYATLDPIRLLSEMRGLQQHLVEIADRTGSDDALNASRRRRWSSSSPVCGRHGRRARHVRLPGPKRKSRERGGMWIRWKPLRHSCARGLRQNRFGPGGNCSNNCRQRILVSIPMGSSAHCSDG
jgi:hypothetical protein